MKNKYRAIFAFIAVSYIITGVFLVFMSEKVPMHYNLKGEIDRFGSKYETLFYPAAISAIGAFILILAKRQGKKHEIGNERVLAVSGIIILVFQNMLNLFSLCRAALFDAAAQPDILKITAIGLGILLTFLCNIMPKASVNNVFGFRTVCSMKNERVWQKSQRSAGCSGMLCGFLMILTGIFFRQTAVAFMLMGIILIWIAITVAASYKIYSRVILIVKREYGTDEMACGFIDPVYYLHTACDIVWRCCFFVCKQTALFAGGSVFCSCVNAVYIAGLPFQPYDRLL